MLSLIQNFYTIELIKGMKSSLLRSEMQKNCSLKFVSTLPWLGPPSVKSEDQDPIVNGRINPKQSDPDSTSEVSSSWPAQICMTGISLCFKVCSSFFLCFFNLSLTVLLIIVCFVLENISFLLWIRIRAKNCLKIKILLNRAHILH
jgi:hypothetical protein